MAKSPMPHVVRAGQVRPHLRARKLVVAGKSAFPPTPRTAFAPAAAAGPGDPGMAFGAPTPGAAAPGDTGG